MADATDRSDAHGPDRGKEPPQPPAAALAKPATEALPLPAHDLSLVYQGDHRLRALDLPPDLDAQFIELMQRIGWSVSTKTADDYRPIIRNYWHFCMGAGVERYRNQSLCDYLYLLAYPRLLYLQHVAGGGAADARGHQPGLGKSSIRTAVAAIGKSFEVTNRPAPNNSPEWRSWLKGLLRRLKQEKDRKDPIIRDDLLRAVDLARQHRNPLIGLRDAALLLLGWSCALRRSEIVQVDLEHIRKSEVGWTLWIPKSKTDQDGNGYPKPLYRAENLAYDAIRACHQWCEAAGIATGTLFRPVDRYGTVSHERLTTRSVANLLKSYSIRHNVSGHSLRVGYVTQAALDGKNNLATRIVTGHTSDAMLIEYQRIIDHQRQGPGSLL